MTIISEIVPETVFDIRAGNLNVEKVYIGKLLVYTEVVDTEYSVDLWEGTGVWAAVAQGFGELVSAWAGHGPFANVTQAFGISVPTVVGIGTWAAVTEDIDTPDITEGVDAWAGIGTWATVTIKWQDAVNAWAGIGNWAVVATGISYPDISESVDAWAGHGAWATVLQGFTYPITVWAGLGAWATVNTTINTTETVAAWAGHGVWAAVTESSQEVVSAFAGHGAWATVDTDIDLGVTGVVKFANFALPSATGNFTIGTSELGGLTPKGVILFLSNNETSESGHSTNNEEALALYGASDGTNQWAMGSSLEINTNNEQRNHSPSHILRARDGQNLATLLEATFSSFQADEVTINIGTLSSELYGKRGFAMFFAGADCDFEVGTIAGDSGDGISSQTVGFTPEGAFIHNSDLTSLATGATATIFNAFGFVLAHANPISYSNAFSRQSGTGVRMIDTDYVAEPSLLSSIGVRAALSGTSLTITANSASDRDVAYAAWSFNGELDAKARRVRIPAATGIVSADGLGLDPEAAFFIFGGNGVLRNQNSAGFLGTGWLDASGGGSQGAEHYIGFASTSRLALDDDPVLVELDSFGTDKVDLDVVDASATAMDIIMLAFGQDNGNNFRQLFTEKRSAGTTNTTYAGAGAIRILVDKSVLKDATKVRAMFRGGTTAGGTIGNCWIGHQGVSIDPWDYDPTGAARLTFNGANGATVPLNGDLETDEVSFAYDNTKNIIIAIDFTANTQMRTIANGSGFTGYYGSTAGDDAGTGNTLATYVASANFLTRLEMLAEP